MTRKIDTAEELNDGRALIIIKLASGAADMALTSDAMAVYRSVGPLSACSSKPFGDHNHPRRSLRTSFVSTARDDCDGGCAAASLPPTNRPFCQSTM